MIDRPIRDFMSPAPVTISRDETLAAAHAIMRSRRVRHLPVVDGSKLVGLVSQSDLYVIESLKDVDPTTVLVEEAMSRPTFAVPPAAPLAKVAAVMVRKRLGSAIIVERGRVVGMFTAIDALRALLARATRAPRSRSRAPVRATR